MPDRRKHRGPHPEDPVAFAPEHHPRLATATTELSWLLGRGYTQAASLKLVGDRHALTLRQRSAVARCACSDARARARAMKLVSDDGLRGQHVLVDGFNVLTTLEVALSGGVVLIARDGAMRDIAGVHGTYRKVDETVPALTLLARFVAELRIGGCRFLLDRPVSNSGRLARLINDHAAGSAWPFEAQVVPDPDSVLATSPAVVATADGDVLDRCQAWYNLARTCVERAVPSAHIVDLSS